MASYLSNLPNLSNLVKGSIKDLSNYKVDDTKIKIIELRSKSIEYIDTIIKIIIFLIFLNLFITTYFYFTSLITANSNRSNCGAGGLTEAETFRHIFLQDNGKDNSRDVYIIIIIIFAIYLFIQISKNVDSSFLKIEEKENKKNKFINLSLIIVIGTIVFVKVFLGETMLGTMIPSIIIIAIFFAITFFKSFNLFSMSEMLDNYYKYIFIGFMVLLFILEIVNIDNNKIFSESENEKDNIKLINPNFNASLAMVLLFSSFYLLCAIHTLVYGFKYNNSVLYLLLLFFIVCFFMFIYVSNLDLNFKSNSDENLKKLEDWVKSSFQILMASKWFALVFPLIFYPLFPETKESIIIYFVLLFLLMLFFVYFLNKESTIGILPLYYFQLYNFTSEENYEKNENKGKNVSENYYKTINQSNFVFILLILFLIIGFLIFNNDDNISNILIPIGVYIIASYTTGFVYLIFNTLFPIQDLSFRYKKELIDINNELSQYIKTSSKEHTINKDKIFNFKLFDNLTDIERFYSNLNGKTDKKEKLELIRLEFRKIAPKGENYDNYVEQSKDQKEYEEYILNIFSTDVYDKIIEKLKLKVYKKLILDVPKVLDNKIDDSIVTPTPLNIPVSNNLEYIIKKNYKYVTGEIGELQKYTYKYNEYTDSELNGLYWIQIPNNTPTANGFKVGDNNYHSDDLNNIIKIEPLPTAERKYFFYTNETDKKFTGNGTITIDKENNLKPDEDKDKTYTLKNVKLNNKDGYIENTSGPVTIDIYSKNAKKKSNITGKGTITGNIIGNIIGINKSEVSGNGKLKGIRKDTETEATAEGQTIITLDPAEHIRWNHKIERIINKTSTEINKKMEEIIIDKDHKIFKMKDEYFKEIREHFKNNTGEKDIHFLAIGIESGGLNLFVSYNFIDTNIVIKNPYNIDEITTYKNIKNTINNIVKEPLFYTIGYDYDNHIEETYNEAEKIYNNQAILKDKLYTLPAKYYACSYLNYHPKSDESMNTLKFQKYIDEKDYNIYIDQPENIVSKIEKSYNKIVEFTKKDLNDNKYYYLLIFLVILAIVILMYILNLIKKLVLNDLYSPQMYVLVILAVFLTVFIFGEVIFSRIK